MNARVKSGSFVKIDGNVFKTNIEIQINLSNEELKLVKESRSNVKDILYNNKGKKDTIEIDLSGKIVSAKISDILLLNEINSHKAIIPKFSEYVDKSGKTQIFNVNIVLNLNNKKIIKLYNLIKVYHEKGEENYVEINVPDIGEIKVHIKYFLISTSHISQIDCNKVYLDKGTLVTEIDKDTSNKENKAPANKKIFQKTKKTDYIISPSTGLSLEEIVDIKQGTNSPHINTTRTIELGGQVLQFEISDLKLTH